MEFFIKATMSKTGKIFYLTDNTHSFIQTWQVEKIVNIKLFVSFILFIIIRKRLKKITKIKKLIIYRAEMMAVFILTNRRYLNNQQVDY